MKQQKTLLWSLAILSSIFLSIPFLIPRTGFFALFALVPLLAMERIASNLQVKRIWIYHYLTFVIWNALTTFWVCNATIGGGLFAIFANAFQMSLIFGLFRLSKKRFKGILPYIFLVSVWIAWEHFYFDAEISWPWLVLGNSFAGSIKSIQWYEYTGSLGGSLWIWLCNLSIFGLMVVLSDGRWNRFNIKAKTAAILGILTLFIAPFITSRVIWNNYEEKENPLEILIIQPNIDPYNKFQAMTQAQQDAIALEQIQFFLDNRDSLNQNQTLLIVAPETFTSGFNINDYKEHQSWQRFTSFLKNYPNVNLLFGASTYEFIYSKDAPSHTARPFYDGMWYEAHNTALIVDGSERTEYFHKSKLVVGVEHTPYPQIFCKLDDALGGVMGRCIGQDEISLLNVVNEEEKIKIGCAVCYESVYGEYYTGYIKKGAEAMTIITNDAWWGDTPGYKQHLRYASLRAIETRRSIARSANTGISAFINQRGEIINPTDWWVPATLNGTINLNDKITFFVKSGDIVGRTSTFIFLLLLLAFLVRSLIKTSVKY